MTSLMADGLKLLQDALLFEKVFDAQIHDACFFFVLLHWDSSVLSGAREVQFTLRCFSTLLDEAGQSATNSPS